MIIEDEKFGVNLNANELKLNYADELVEDMRKEYYKYSKLLELAKKDRIEVIKYAVRYIYHFETLLTSAQSWIHMCEDKSLDKRKKYVEKEDFEYLQNILREEIFKNPSLEITSIKFGGYEKYNCSIEFKVSISDSTKFEIVIPNLSLLNEKRWDNMHGGKLALYYEKKESVWDCICTSYKEEDVEKALKNFLMFGNKNIKMMET
jgi:hypothetical protein